MNEHDEAYVDELQALFDASGRTIAPAGSNLARARINAHMALDVIWKFGAMKRSQAYAWLAKEMKLPIERCHIGMFDETQCARVIEICDHRGATK